MANKTNEYFAYGQPLVGTWRGDLLECIQSGAVAITDKDGNLTASVGNPQLVTYLRSSMKPFQVLPFVEAGGVEQFNLSAQELAILCSSHHGTDGHVDVLKRIQEKVGISENFLQCGVHPPYSKSAQYELIRRGESPTPNRHNCSGKHTGMLAMCKLMGWPLENYLDPQHPLQQLILKTFTEMTNTSIHQISFGTDGCSAPVFAIPLHNSAMGFARLVDPSALNPLRAEACRKITTAMLAYPEMIAGQGGFDTCLMQATKGKIIAKSGAEGYLALGLLGGTRDSGSKALGVAIKIIDGDTGGDFYQGADHLEGRARPIVGLEILRQLGALAPAELEKLAAFGPRFQKNWRGFSVGRFEPVFKLNFEK
jgi:L-asparaginase II